nr:histidine-rich glycoprotein-like isoform X1 [Parasteatoda tepidariorum]
MLTKIILSCLLIAVTAADQHHDHHEHHHAHPYKFGYVAKGKDGSHHRHEEGDGHGGVKGSYGYVDHHGIHREVHYVADKGGFRAEVKTNEPGTANQDPAHVKLHSHASHHHHQEPHHHHHQEPHHAQHHHHQQPHHAHHHQHQEPHHAHHHHHQQPHHAHHHEHHGHQWKHHA